MLRADRMPDQRFQQLSADSRRSERAPVPILHLMNVVGASSIGRIIAHLVTSSTDPRFRWHIGGVGGLWEDFPEELARRGAQVVDFSNRGGGSRSLSKRIRDYLALHHIQIVHTHSPRTRLAASMALVAAPCASHLATEHSLYMPRDRRWGFGYSLLDRLTLYSADHIVTVSRVMRRQVVKLPGIRLERVTAVQNSVDCDTYHVPEQRADCRSEFNLSPELNVIGYTGRIDHVKRLDLLLQGFAQVALRHPQTRLLIIGDGEQRSELEALAGRLGISQLVIWTGFRQDIPRLLAAIDLYVQPSVNEGLCLSILEAMAAGKPVIATDVGGTREVLTDQKTGLLIPPGSSSAIAAVITDLLEHPEKKTGLGQAAREHVIQEFGVQKMVEGYRRVYESLASKQRSGSMATT